jgi:hypothetical protein
MFIVVMAQYRQGFIFIRHTFFVDEPRIKCYLKQFNFMYIGEHGTFAQGTQDNSETALFELSLKASDDEVQRYFG